MIIVNEVEYVRNILISGEKPENMTPNGLIRYLSLLFVPYFLKKDLPRYQKESLDTSQKALDKFIHKCKKEYVQFIIDIMREFNLPSSEYQEYKHISYVRKIVEKILEHSAHMQLREITEVNITEKEIEIIQKAKTERERKVMFTLYVLAKVNVNPTGWVNYPVQDIFNLANVRLSSQERYKVIHSLYLDGLINLNHVINKHGYKVELFEDSRIAMTVTDFTNIGNQYLDKYKDGWKMCPNCGRMFRKVINIQKYCKTCANGLYAMKNRQQHYQKYHNSPK